MIDIDRIGDNVRMKTSPFYSWAYQLYKYAMDYNIHIPKVISKTLYNERIIRHNILRFLTNKFYYEPILRSRCFSCGKNLKTDGDIPLIIGSGKIILGENVSIGNRSAWILTPNLYDEPELIVGNNTAINYLTGISVECRVEIGNDCLIAGESMIYDNNSHSIHYTNNRIMNKDDVSPVKIMDHVWIGMRSMILKGVTIGEGSVVAAGSIVTKDVPPMTVVGGNPARTIKKIKLF